MTSIIRTILFLAFFAIALSACSKSSTDSGIEQGSDTKLFAGNYEGVLELTLTADAIGYNPKSNNGVVPIELEITRGGVVRLAIDNNTVEGIIDNDGDWKLEVAINDFSALIEKKNMDALRKAGCPLDRPVARIEGTVATIDILGDANGKLSCKILFVTIASLKFSGTLTASKL